MTAQDVRADAPTIVPPFRTTSPTRLLAAALLHLLDRDEPLPARWQAAAFTEAVARHRIVAGAMISIGDLDRLAQVLAIGSFAAAVDALARDPLAASLAVRRIELFRDAPLPAWPQFVRYGLSPRVTSSELGWWSA
jgi:hypothetical protein